MSTGLPPHLIQRMDQEDARIADIVRNIRQHLTDGCDIPEFCIGADQFWALADMDCADCGGLLRAALVRLARTPDPHAGAVARRA
jgi:hypothetical protein